jgi:hypothetical protein
MPLSVGAACIFGSRAFAAERDVEKLTGTGHAKTNRWNGVYRVAGRIRSAGGLFTSYNLSRGRQMEASEQK